MCCTLQPYVLQTATLCAPRCNPYAVQARMLGLEQRARSEMGPAAAALLSAPAEAGLLLQGWIASGESGGLLLRCSVPA